MSEHNLVISMSGYDIKEELEEDRDFGKTVGVHFTKGKYQEACLKHYLDYIEETMHQNIVGQVLLNMPVPKRRRS